MPIIKSAKKRARQTIVRRKRNLITEGALRDGRVNLASAISAGSKPKIDEALKAYQSAIDKAVKKRIISKARASRLLSRAMRDTGPVKQVAKKTLPKKATPKKTAAKKPTPKKAPAKKKSAAKK